MKDIANIKEFQELADACLDGRASAAQARRLEQLAHSSPELMRHFVDLSLLNASLMHGVENSSMVPASVIERGMHSHWLSFNNVAIASAVVFLIALTASAFLWNLDPRKKTFATLDATAGTRWISASVPTDTGSQIGIARLKLAAGLVTIRFDVGAVLELEGPADLEIINPTRCRLNSGKLLTTVHTDFKGFVVETPNAILTDQGTSFCVSVQPSGDSEMHVLEGRVDVEDRTTGVEKTVLGQSGVRLSPGEIVESHDIEQGSAEPPFLSSANHRVVHLTTSMGGGADYWVQRDALKPGSDRVSLLSMLLVKWSNSESRIYDRKAYLKFDLSSIDSQAISNASLQLNATPSGLGFASLTIDSTFAVYGVTDEALDDLPVDFNWNNAPAHSQSGGAVDTRVARLLGRFVIPQGVQEGTFSIQSPELLEYLKKDQNQIASMVIVCETRSVESASLVFAFAASNNESLLPPTLRLELSK